MEGRGLRWVEVGKGRKSGNNYNSINNKKPQNQTAQNVKEMKNMYKA